LIVGDSYCVEENFGIPPVSSTTTSTSTGDGVTTPTPYQTGLVSNCNAFYLVKTGDQCGTIASQYGLTLAEFYAWNPAVGSTCNTLVASDYVCVGIIGLTITKTTSTPGNGISTPQPIQTGMVSNCDKFYLVQPGDGCANIAAAYSITLAQFYAWNPAVGNTCAGLDANDYVCVNIVGNTLTTTTTTTKTTPTNGISTPQPIQTGLVANCNKFYLVQSGDSCAPVAAKFGVPLSTFYAWNPAVGTTCANLDVGDYVCVDIIGFVPSTTTTTHPTTTTAGNGVTTPTPIEPGMVTNCNKFHYVVSGDQCGTIATAAGITLANFIAWNPMVGSTCSDLWLSAYVCIGIL
jgi:LysM repeat protein